MTAPRPVAPSDGSRGNRVSGPQETPGVRAGGIQNSEVDMKSVQQDSNPDTKPGITEGSRAWFAARSAAEPTKLWLIDGETRYQLRWPLDGEEYTLTVECDEQLEAARQAWQLLTLLKANGITTLRQLQASLESRTRNHLQTDDASAAPQAEGRSSHEK